MDGNRAVALIGGIVLVVTLYLLAALVALTSPHSAGSTPHAGGLSRAEFVRLAAARCNSTRTRLGPHAVRNGGRPSTRSALHTELTVTRAENRALTSLAGRARMTGVERVPVLRFVRTHGRLVTTLRLAVRTSDVAQAAKLVEVAYGRVTPDADALGLMPCGLG